LHFRKTDADTPYDFQVRTSGLEALSAAASGKNYSYPVPASTTEYQQSPSQFRPVPHPQASFPQDLSFILNQSSPEDATSPPIDPRLHTELAATSPFATAQHVAREGRLAQSLPPSIDNDVDDIPFLLRHFSEGPGHWMDLFDLGRFFEIDVPVKANQCPLLLYSAVALAAKSLGRMDRSAKRFKSPGPSYSSAEWLHKARTYYDTAINLLRQTLEVETRPMSSSQGHPSVRPTSSGSYGENMPLQSSSSLPRTDSDELVGTTAILCVYEFLDGSGLEWSSHLNGAKSLFDIAKDGVMAMPTESPSSYRRSTFSHRPVSNSRRAIFWNIVRQDMLEACKCLPILPAQTLSNHPTPTSH